MKILGKIIKVVALAGLFYAVIKAVKEGRSIKKVMDTYETKVKFNSRLINYNKEVVENKSVALLCSSAEIDFNESKLESKQGILDIFGRFSAIKVKVPEQWKVILSGAADNSAIQNDVDEADGIEDGPVLNIQYDLKMSALSVVNINEEVIDEVEEVLEETLEEIIDIEEVEVLEEEVTEEVTDIEEVLE